MSSSSPSHRHDCGGLDVFWLDALDLAFGRCHVPRAVDQLEFLEHRLDGFQVVIGVHVEHGVVLVVKLAVRFNAGVVALEQILEVVEVALGMAVRVHGHKTGVLQKSRDRRGGRRRESYWARGRSHCSQPLKALVMARLLTAVGDLRASMGPPIMVMDSGVFWPREAISEMAANTGTVGWQTLMTWQLP